MQKTEYVQIVTGEHIMEIPKDELWELGDVLRRAINDPDLVSRSHAPELFLKELPQSFDEVSYSNENREVRAGDWLLVADGGGFFWQYRILPPHPPQIGLMFKVRLVRSKDGWMAPEIIFQRLR